MLVQEVAQEVAAPQEHASHHKNQKCHISAVYPQELWNARSKKKFQLFCQTYYNRPLFLIEALLIFIKIVHIYLLIKMVTFAQDNIL